jgi:anti-sigma B factor antagonist
VNPWTEYPCIPRGRGSRAPQQNLEAMEKFMFDVCMLDGYCYLYPWGDLMDILINEDSDAVHVSVVGDIEMMSIKNFKEKLFEIGNNADKDIEIDLSQVDYIDSSGVGVLISLLKLQKKKGKNLNIKKVSSKVLSVLKLSSLSDVFEM